MQICFGFFVTLAAISFSGPAPLIPVGFELAHKNKNTSLLQYSVNPDAGTTSTSSSTSTSTTTHTTGSTTCSAVKSCHIDTLIDDVVHENEVITQECLDAIESNKAEKIIHDARIKAVKEFQQSVNGNFCGHDKIVEWLTLQETKWTTRVEVIEVDCGVDITTNTTLIGIKKEIGGVSCITTTQVTAIVEKITNLITINEKDLERCQKEVTVLISFKEEHTQEINALEEFQLYVGETWCGITILTEFITEKKAKWTISDHKITENCKTYTEKATSLQKIIETITTVTTSTTAPTCTENDVAVISADPGPLMGG